jgi:Uma2 family endonuclease
MIVSPKSAQLAAPFENARELLRYLGDIPPERMLLDPAPGYATEADVLARQAAAGQLCELVAGVLVEKTMGWEESAIALELAYFLKRFLKRHRLGILLGTDGPVRTIDSQVRMPDLCFVRKGRLPKRRPARPAVLQLAPDLAVEVLSKSNTAAEMRIKLEEYFQAGVQIVWLIDHRTRTARIHTAPNTFTEIGERGFLTAAAVLPGFKLRLKTLLDEALDVE